MITNFDLDMFLILLGCYSIVVYLYVLYRCLKRWVYGEKKTDATKALRTNNTKVNVHNTKPIIKYKK